MKFLLILLSFLLSLSCSEFGDDRADNVPSTPDNEQGSGDNNSGSSGGNTQTPPTEWGDERSYVFDITHVPEVRMTVSLDEWNRLLAAARMAATAIRIRTVRVKVFVLWG